jgi:hypothetical protein
LAKSSSSSLAKSSSSNELSSSSSSSGGDISPIIQAISNANLLGNVKVEVYDLRGRPVTIPVQTKGLYIVKVKHENSGDEVMKLLVR